MNLPLVMAGMLTISFGILHSLVGELRFLPTLEHKRGIASEPLVSSWQMSVLRGSWHTLSIFGYGLGAVLLTLAFPHIKETICVTIPIGIACAAVGLYWIYATKFWHPAWIAFFLIAALCWCS